MHISIGILSSLLKPGPKEQERKKRAKERKEREQQIKMQAFQVGRERAIRSRAYREGQVSAKPLTQRIGEGFGKFQSGLGKVEKGLGRIEKSSFLDYDFGLGLEPTRKRKHKKRRR